MILSKAKKRVVSANKPEKVGVGMLAKTSFAQWAGCVNPALLRCSAGEAAGAERGGADCSEELCGSYHSAQLQAPG